MAESIVGPRLPPLQALHNQSAIESDELPVTIETGPLFSPESTARSSIPVVRVEDVESNIHCLTKSFEVLDPGDYVCVRTKRFSSNFVHYKNSVHLAQHYSDVRKLMVNRSKLLLIQDYSSRILEATDFIQNLQEIAHQEYHTWCQLDTSTSNQVATKLEFLASICDDLRTHTAHWNLVKQRIHTDKWLRPLLPSLCRKLEPVRIALQQLGGSAIWWVERIVRIGLQVFAHTNLSRVTQDSLWNIARGVEEFNSIVQHYNRVNCNRERYRFPSSSTSSLSTSGSGLHGLQVTCSNSVHNYGEKLKTVPIHKVLSILACERSKHAAKLTFKFFTSNKEFLSIANTKLPNFDWQTYPRDDKVKSAYPSNTSDYHSDGSMGSVTSEILRVGEIKAPDLSQEMSPVVDFTTREEEFLTVFLSTVATSTNLLRKAHSSKDGVGSPAKVHFRGRKTRGERKAKSVHWGDSMDTNTKQQLIAKYMDHMWQNFGGRLLELLHSQAWGIGYSTIDDLGHVQLCANTVIMMLVQMIELICVKDMFAPGAVVSLQSLARQLHAAAAVADWDAGFCDALSSSVIDKCLPLSMGAGEHRTKTAMLFQEAFHPLVSLLMSAEQTPVLRSPSRGKNGLPIYPRNAVVTVTIPALARLLTTLNSALKWSHTKTLQFLSSWSIGAFLLITQSDLKTLTDTALRVLKLAQPLCTTSDVSTTAAPSGVIATGSTTSGSHDIQLNNRLNQLWHQLNAVTSKLHNLSSTSSKLFGQDCTRMSTEYWQQAMPIGKVWKRKSNQDYPTEPNAYVESAVETILEPVTEGVSKLKTAAQISAVTVAVVAVLEAWMNNILKEKIKFSLFGAHQLHLDFNYVRQWISSDMSGLSQETQQSVLALDVFKHMEGAVQLLKQQPKRRSKARRDFKEDCCSEYSTSTNAGTESRRNSLLGNTLFPTADGAASSSEASGSDIMEGNLDEEAYHVPRRDEWLALRVHAGNRWKLPLGCLNPQPHEV
ncbi:uncharacterized protein [Ptychodera flava]|uniref:uncharacterized protein isoform X2 n=1 Tax=Ptychodera flava TaxID=63121 RepID=UPI003969C11C